MTLFQRQHDKDSRKVNNTTFLFTPIFRKTQAETLSRPMEPSSSNGFGSNTYWNRPTSRGRTNRPSRSLSPAYRQSNENSASTSASTARAFKRPNSPSTATVNQSPVFNTEFNTEHGDVKVTADPSLKLKRSPGVSRTQPDMTMHHTYMQDLYAELDVKDDKAMVKLM